MEHVMTVTGPKRPKDLGIVMPHEHVFMAMLEEYRPDPGLLFDYELMREEILHYKGAGGGTLVDVTSVGLGRQPEMLKAIAEDTGLTIIMGCGFYRDPYISKEFFDTHSVDQVADAIVTEIEAGVGDTGIRPGIIGEIGCNRWYLSAAEERSFRAAARASVRTGLPVSTHATRWPVGLDQHDILTAEGVPPQRIIIGHCDTVPSPDYHHEVAKRGSYVQFDTIRGKNDFETDRRIRYVLDMLEHGYERQLLLSQDICLTSYLHAIGGNGYDYLLSQFVPLLRKHGVDDATVRLLLEDNPQRALTGAL